MKRINFYNEYHLGDCFHHLHYCKKLLEMYDDIIINFYFNFKYIDELLKYYHSDRLQLLPIGSQPNNTINCWIGESSYVINFHKEYMPYMNYDSFYVSFLKQLSNQIGLDSPIQTEYDMLLDSQEITQRKFEHFDYLIINSTPFSGQYPFPQIEPEFNDLINKLKGKIITTKKVNGFACTTDYDLTLLGIAQLSLYVDIVIGIHTSPMIPTFNKWSINKIKQWIIIREQPITYSYKNVMGVDNIKNISL